MSKSKDTTKTKPAADATPVATAPVAAAAPAVALATAEAPSMSKPTAPAAPEGDGSSNINPKLVQQLREKTGLGMMDCKKALVEAKGDINQAEIILRQKHAKTVEKKAGREAKEGVIGSYIHIGDKVGVLIEINCETDFVARNEGFRTFVKDVTLQVAAAAPLFVKRDEVPEHLLAVEREVAAGQVAGKPAAVIEKIIAGKLDKYYATVCLLEQSFVKDNTKTISDLLAAKVAELGENIVIRRFTRFQVGEVLGGAPKTEEPAA